MHQIFPYQVGMGKHGHYVVMWPELFIRWYFSAPFSIIVPLPLTLRPVLK